MSSSRKLNADCIDTGAGCTKVDGDFVKTNLGSNKDKTSATSGDDQRNGLPKPDAQSPKSQ